MSRRQDGLRFKVMPNGDILAFQSDTYDKRGVSEWMITNPKNESPTLTTETGIKVFIKEEIDMNERDFHRHCRVVYRAMRRQYGTEKVQDECMRVFKVVFPFLHSARKGEDYEFDKKALERTRKIFESWHPTNGSELDNLLGNILDTMEGPMEKNEFVAFCEDILVVVMKIRKLSVREVYRLQGVNEKDIDTLLSCGISKSSHYRLAGNSISAGGRYVNKDGQWDGPLFNIFRKLLIETGPDIVKGEAIQMSLF